MTIGACRIALRGISEWGCHGANPGERITPQEFVVDLDLTVHPNEDSLDSTVDYRVITEVAREAVRANSFALLESLALCVVRAVRGHPGVSDVRAVVHKPSAAQHLGVADVYVEATAP